MSLPIIVADFLASMLAVWLLVQLHQRDPDPPLRHWAAAFACQALTTILVAHRLYRPEVPWAMVLASLAALVAAVFMVYGTLLFLGWRVSRRWLMLPAVLLVFSLVSSIAGLPFVYEAMPVVAAMGGSLMFVGVAVARGWRDSVGARVAGLGLILYGLHILDYPVAVEYPHLLAWGHMLAAVLQMTICAGFVLLYFERASLRLGEREAQYRALFENAAAGIFVADASGTIIAANEALVALVAPGQSLEGRQLKSLFSDQEQTGSVLSLGEDETMAQAAQWRGLDENILDVQLYIRRVPSVSGPSQLEGVVVDVTRAELLERHIDRIQRVEVLGQLAGGIAHDINNVLTVVIANADLITRIEHTTSAGAKLVGAIREAAEHGANLTRQLLTFTRRHRSMRDSFELGPRVLKTTRMLESTLAENIELVLDVARDGCGVQADPSLIEQLVVNLVINARDALPDGGRISLVVKHADRPDAPPPPLQGARSLVVLEVRDNGIGMDAATQQRAFEPFFSTKPEATGTGLGLAIVKRVVDQSSGVVDIESGPGRGTLISIRFPHVEVRDGAGAHGSTAESSAGDEPPPMVEDRPDGPG